MVTTIVPVDAATYAEVVDVLSRHPLLVDNRVDRLDDAGPRATGLFATAYTPQTAQELAGSFVSFYDADPDRVPFPHHATDVAVHRVDDDTLRVWAKYFVIRGDGTAGSGDYQETFVRTPDGWRVSDFGASRGNRPADDPDGPSTRTYTRETWLSPVGQT